MSRFARAGLPSPKNYLAAIRLLHAAFLFETAGLSVADVAYRLEYSSPQSFGRHLRAMLGLTALEFRRRFPFPLALERFVDADDGAVSGDLADVSPAGGGELGGWTGSGRAEAVRRALVAARGPGLARSRAGPRCSLADQPPVPRQHRPARRSCGSAGTRYQLAPVMVRAASMALMIASSVACTAAS